MLGLSEDDLRRASPSASARTARGRARRSGRALRADSTATRLPAATHHAAHRCETHDPDRATLVIRHRRRAARDDRRHASSRNVDADGAGHPDRAARHPHRPAVRRRRDRSRAAVVGGRACAPAATTRRAPATACSISPDGARRLSVILTRGPHVVVAFTGDPLPGAERERSCRSAPKASADEDLLEDSSRAIEAYLHARGYRRRRCDIYARGEARRADHHASRRARPALHRSAPSIHRQHVVPDDGTRCRSSG